MKPSKTPVTHSIPSAFLFLLIGIFALTSLTLTLFGTRVYRQISEFSAQSGDSQIALNYLGNKVRTYDAQGGVHLEDRDGLPVLCLSETLEGQRYQTLIYTYEGYIWEFFAAEGEPFAPDQGERLTVARSLTFQLLSPQLLQATIITATGETQTLRMALRSDANGEAS